MKKSLKQYSLLSQILIVLGFYIGFMMLEVILDSILVPLFCGYRLPSFEG
jgi:hypothetical protein